METHSLTISPENSVKFCESFIWIRIGAATLTNIPTVCFSLALILFRMVVPRTISSFPVTLWIYIERADMKSVNTDALFSAQ